ncbi:MAG TPA: SAM-dependent methyltransferase [Lachnospiraceae bacterium]|nr:SAM-dependent methyltransferase [Lachnospiraceae bacterium]
MWEFLKEYIAQPDTIGAIAPSGRYLASAMADSIDFAKARCIVEYGSGTGVFTREVILRKKPDTVYIVIEQNGRFYEMLRKQFQRTPGVVLVHGDASDVCGFLEEQGFRHADYIISGLPFTSLPEQVSRRILSGTRKAVGTEGIFTTFQYTLLRKRFLEEYFHIREIRRIWRNLPPAYILNMKPSDNLVAPIS